MSLKSTLEQSAKALRLIAYTFEHWPWIILAVCIVSPISPHIRLPYQVSYSDCAYVGTRGIMLPSASNCPPIAFINTVTGEVVSW